MPKNVFAAGALPQTPLGELTALSIPLTGFKGPTSIKGRGGHGESRWEGKDREEKGESKGEREGRGIPVLLSPL